MRNDGIRGKGQFFFSFCVRITDVNLSPRLLKEEVLILKLFSENPAWGYMTELSFDGIDREKLYFLLKKHKLLRAFASRRFPDSPFDVPSDISRQIRNILLLADMEKQIYRETLERVGLIFDKAGITFCLIKGYSLGNIETARDVNDLDILIHEGDLERVDLLLKEKGFFYVGGERKAFMKKEDRCGDFASLKKWSNQFEYRNRKK